MSKEISKNNAGDFNEILSIIEKARENIYRAVNCELISMYWDIGRDFSFLGEEYRVQVGNKDFFIDLLFIIVSSLVLWLSSLR